VEVDLPRPRDRVALSEDVRYHHLRRTVLEFLYSKHAQKAA
jgi:nitrate/nitrite transport system ATP-binding protein